MSNLLTRRTALKAVMVAVGYATATPQPSSSPTSSDLLPTPFSTPTASPTQEQLAAQATEFLEQHFFVADWSAGQRLRFPRVLDLRGVASDVDILVRWDDRLFSVSETVLALTDQVIEVQTSQLDGGGLRVTVPAGTTTLFFDASSVLLYPFENIDAPVATSVLVREVEPGLEADLLTLDVEKFSASPWGMELSAQWTTVKGLMVPQAVQVLSVGPLPVPAGATVQALCAGAMDRGSLIAPEGVAISVETSSNQSLVRITLTEPLAAAEARLVIFAPDAATTVPVANPEAVSRVWVEAGSDPLAVRQTGKLSIFPITDSGIPVSTFKEISPTA